MIAPRLVRTVPAETSPQVEDWWARACALHPGWEFTTWREPIDPKRFPLSSPHWHRCTSGAQKAGLIRLEDFILRGGGIYLDSDVEVFRPLDSLLHLDGFAAWEDERTIPDAVLGFAFEHPAPKLMLDLAIERLCSTSTDWATGNGAWSTGPGVTTTVLPGRDDVLLLPPGSFFDVHYTEKDQLGRPSAPWTFARHHWHASWLPAGT